MNLTHWLDLSSYNKKMETSFNYIKKNYYVNLFVNEFVAFVTLNYEHDKKNLNMLVRCSRSCENLTTLLFGMGWSWPLFRPWLSVQNQWTCEGLLRECHGRWLGGFSKRIGRSNAFIAELWEVLRGMQMAQDKGCVN